MIHVPPIPDLASDRGLLCLVFSAKGNCAESTRSYTFKVKIKVNSEVMFEDR